MNDMDTRLPMTTFESRLKSLKTLAGAHQTFDTDAVPATPHALFEQWFDAAVEARVSEPHVMTLSTVDQDGAPDARSVVLLNMDAQGWHFAANATSPKGHQLTLRPEAAMTFYWPATAQQIRLRGKVRRLSDEACRADFMARPERSRASILIGRQSDVLNSRDDLRHALHEQLARVASQPELVSPHWGMYALTPHQVEFWQSDAERRFTRLRYVHAGTGTGNGADASWERSLLWP